MIFLKKPLPELGREIYNYFMEMNILTIILAMLGSSVLTALITSLSKRRTDQAVINDTLLENARMDITQIRQENLS